MGFLPFLTLILITLKLLNVITLSWFLVWLPLFIPFIVMAFLALLCIVFGKDVYINTSKPFTHKYFKMRDK